MDLCASKVLRNWGCSTVSCCQPSRGPNARSGCLCRRVHYHLCLYMLRFGIGRIPVRVQQQQQQQLLLVKAELLYCTWYYTAGLHGLKATCHSTIMALLTAAGRRTILLFCLSVGVVG
jgi:hypothetical protein